MQINRDPATKNRINHLQRWIDAVICSSIRQLPSPDKLNWGLKGHCWAQCNQGPCPNSVPNRALRNSPRKAITFLTKVLNGHQATLSSSIEKCQCDFLAIPLPLPYRSISLLDTIGKLFENAFQAYGRNHLLRPPKGQAFWVSTGAQHDPPVGLNSWTNQKKFWRETAHWHHFLVHGLTFDSTWIWGLAFQANHTRILVNLVKLITSYLHFSTFVVSFQVATSSFRLMRAWVIQEGVISPVFFSIYMNNISTT